MNTSERHIIQACLRRDRIAQKALYEQHKIFLFGVCMRYSSTKNEAEDILQEGFVLIFRDLNKFKGEGALRAWMRKVMVNAALMNIRKKSKLKIDEWEDNYSSIQKIESTPYEDFDRAQSIIRMLRKLPFLQQTVFNLKAMEGYSYKEIAEKLDIKENTIRSHYLRARTKLQSLLQKELH